MTSQISQLDTGRIESLFSHQTGLAFEQLLVPISDAKPSGDSLKSNGVYSAIKQARSADDPNLPMGVWQHDLKVADWDEVSTLAVTALQSKTKDLQLMVWLLEAQIHKFGFNGIAPAVHLMSEITDNFWSDMYPHIDDGDLEYRTNLIAWLNDKLQPTIRQLPITQTRAERQFIWAEWEIAVNIEMRTKVQTQSKDYVDTRQISQAIAATPIEYYQTLYQSISDALISLDRYSLLLDEKCQQDAPSLEGIMRLLMEIRETLVMQVRPRQMAAPADEDHQEPSASNSKQIPSGGDSGGVSDDESVDNREKAYAQLADAAAFLMQDDPHSPAPYLVFKAIEWGKLNTAELYQELFVEQQGQLNIFELLGLNLEEK